MPPGTPSPWRSFRSNVAGLQKNLIIRYEFAADKYRVQISDLTTIWSEVLERSDILKRADALNCPIDASEGSQCKILLKHIQDALEDQARFFSGSHQDAESLQLEITAPLPEPLPAIKWFFSMKSSPNHGVQSELVFPLLSSVYLQTQAIQGLTKLIEEKDKAIDRMLDKMESSRLDFSAVFPLPSGRNSAGQRKRLVLERVKGFQPFTKNGPLAYRVEETANSLNVTDLLNHGLSLTGDENVKHVAESASRRNTQVQPSTTSFSAAAGDGAEEASQPTCSNQEDTRTYNSTTERKNLSSGASDPVKEEAMRGDSKQGSIGEYRGDEESTDSDLEESSTHKEKEKQPNETQTAQKATTRRLGKIGGVKATVKGLKHPEDPQPVGATGDRESTTSGKPMKSKSRLGRIGGVNNLHPSPEAKELTASSQRLSSRGEEVSTSRPETPLQASPSLNEAAAAPEENPANIKESMESAETRRDELKRQLEESSKTKAPQAGKRRRKF